MSALVPTRHAATRMGPRSNLLNKEPYIARLAVEASVEYEVLVRLTKSRERSSQVQQIYGLLVL